MSHNKKNLKIEKPIQNPKLNTLGATALFGNDIFSSVFYITALVLPIAGVWAPLAMLLVSGVLFCFRGIYREIVESLPINGGTYNALINASTKRIAAVSGILMILAYLTTAIISAKTGASYLLNSPFIKKIFSIETVDLNHTILLLTVLLLSIATIISLIKRRNATKIAVGLFVMHLLSLLILVIFSLVYFIRNPELSQFANNITNTENLISGIKMMTNLPLFLPFLLLIFLGFSNSLLGLSGFESSANLIEEQKKGVFKKTLQNMVLGVSIINPLIALIFLNLFDLSVIRENASYLLSYGGLVVGGAWLEILITLNAFLILVGAVVASIIGVSRLIARMALDECLPVFFEKKENKNPYLNSYLKTIVVFFLCCLVVLFISKGNITVLSGIYGIAFLSVMSMFATSNLILKNTRRYLKRKFYWPTHYVIIGLIAVFVGLVGKVISHDGIFSNSSNLIHFLTYFIPLFLFISFYLNIDFIYIWVTKLFKRNAESHRKFLEIISGSSVIFVHDIRNLYKLLNYISINEIGRNVLIVHCKNPKSNDRTFEKIEEALPILNKTGVHRHLHIKAIKLDYPFGPKAIEQISKDYSIPKNHIFIGSIHDHHLFDYDELGGVRIIAA